jgi:anti-sigma regulatory factor (Ser/Thr protein kinase)
VGPQAVPLPDRSDDAFSFAPFANWPADRTVSREFRPGPEVSASGRHFILDELAERGVGSVQASEIALAGCELVTNAVVHAQTTLWLFVATDIRRVAVAVRDLSSSMPRHPGRGPLDLTGDSGRGLRLVDALCDEWGVTMHAVGKTIWFAAARRGPILTRVVTP